MVYTLTVLVVVVLTTTLCSGIPREDMLQFGAVQTDGFNSLERPLNMFGTLVELTQVSLDNILKMHSYNTLLLLGNYLIQYITQSSTHTV